MWIEIQRTDAEQPFHVVFKAGNGHETFWCENLVTRANALRVIKKHVAGFPVGKIEFVKIAGKHYLRIWETSELSYDDTEIRERDLRTKP